MRRALLLCSILTLAAGCATAGTGATPENRPSRRDTNVITAEELANAPETDLYGAISRLRPSFFEKRGVASLGVGTQPEAIRVYVDGTRAGDLSVLYQIRPMEVQEVRRLSASEATQAYGTGHTMGAIVVKRK